MTLHDLHTGLRHSDEYMHSMMALAARCHGRIEYRSPKWYSLVRDIRTIHDLMMSGF